MQGKHGKSSAYLANSNSIVEIQWIKNEEAVIGDGTLSDECNGKTTIDKKKYKS